LLDITNLFKSDTGLMLVSVSVGTGWGCVRGGGDVFRRWGCVRGGEDVLEEVRMC
jgi:hypothetical protein